MKSWKFLFVPCCLAVLLLAATTAQAGVYYDLTDLGYGNTPNSMNENGEVVMVHKTPSTDYQGMYYDGTTTTPFTSMSGWQDIPMTRYPMAISEEGVIMGSTRMSVSGTGMSYVGFRWKPGTAAAYGIVPGNLVFGDAVGAERFSGYVEFSDGGKAGFVVDNPTPPTLSAPGYPGVLATRMNNSGHVAGVVANSSGEYAALWTGSLSAPTLLFQGTANQNWDSVAVDVNNLGQVVGWLDMGSGPEGFMWDNGVLTMLTGIAEARFINDAGVIVGKDAAGRWVAYDPRIGHTVLLDPETGFSQSVAGVTDLDEKGRILGFVELADARNGFILSPTSVSVTPTTPIPGAVWLLGSGLAGLFGWRRKRRVH